MSLSPKTPATSPQYENRVYGEFRLYVSEGVYSIQELSDLLAAALQLRDATRKHLQDSMVITG